MVTELYKSVSFKVGALANWQKVRSLFIDGAIVVLPAGRYMAPVFSVQAFVEDFSILSFENDRDACVAIRSRSG